MLTPDEILERYYLEARRDLLEVAALLDRYDASVERSGVHSPDETKLTVLRTALNRLADPEDKSGERTKELLELFAEI